MATSVTSFMTDLVTEMSTVLDENVTMATTDGFQNTSIFYTLTDPTAETNMFTNFTDWMSANTTADPNSSYNANNGTVNGAGGVRGRPQPNQLLLTVYFYCSVVFLPIICILGVTGNIFNLIVLSRKEMRSSTTCFLIGLAVSDLLLCTINIPEAVLAIIESTSYPTPTHVQVKRVYNIATYYLGNVFITCTSWMTIAVTLERFIAIRLPHKVRLICTVKRACIITPVLFLASMLGHLSKCFEARVNVDLRKPAHELTALGRDSTYQTIMHWANISLAVLIPFFLLVIANSLLVYYLIQYSKAPELSSSRSTSSSHRHNIHITTAVIVMVLVFLCCHSLGIYTAFNIAINGRELVFADPLNQALALINNLLVVVNSSVNFILYCLISARFRKMFKLAICGKKKNNKGLKSTPIVKNVNRYKLSTSSTGTASTSGGSLKSKRRTSPNVSRNNMKLSQLMNSEAAAEERKLSLKLSNASCDATDDSAPTPETSKKANNNNKKDDKNEKKKTKDPEVDNWISSSPNDSIELPDVTEPFLKPPATVQRSTSAPDPNLRVATVNKKNLNRNLSDRKLLPCGAQRIELPNTTDKEGAKSTNTTDKDAAKPPTTTDQEQTKEKKDEAQDKDEVTSL